MQLARYAVSLVLMVAIIGGTAWVAQHLQRWQAVAKPAPQRDKELVRFALEATDVGGQIHVRAIWNKTGPNPYREFEPGDIGHYDFLFKNILDQDIELVHYSSTCDCASMVACALPMAEVERLSKFFEQKPGDPLPYQTEPKWEELPRDPLKPIHLKVKANEGGVVRVRWTAKKSAGSELRVNPSVWIQPDGDPSNRKSFTLHVPAMMTHPVRIYPPRINVGPLIPGSVVKAEFDAWSPTREAFKLGLTAPGSEPFFVVETAPLSKEACAALERSMIANKVPTRVKAGYHVTIAVHESNAGQQLDLGSFYRKFAIMLDGNLMLDMPGPEVVGRVQGDLAIGGFDDQGKIRFKSFDLASGASKTVDLLAAADVTLKPVEHHSHQPTWLQIRLTPDKNPIDGKKRIWHLEVTVPPRTPVARSFDEPDAVVLQIERKGELPRLVRIPLEGHVSGR
jgi:hypothetical protein